METVSPTISKQAKHLMLQSAAIHRWTIESADAASAFLQAGQTEESRRLWTYGVPELANALKVNQSKLIRILGATYRFTNAPRVFGFM